MADYIDREALKKKVNHLLASQFIAGGSYVLDEIVKAIRSVPSVDAVEVVRCKDCKYNGKPYCDLLTTGSRDWYINDNDYCKWGEKE